MGSVSSPLIRWGLLTWEEEAGFPPLFLGQYEFTRIRWQYGSITTWQFAGLEAGPTPALWPTAHSGHSYCLRCGEPQASGHHFRRGRKIPATWLFITPCLGYCSIFFLLSTTKLSSRNYWRIGISADQVEVAFHAYT